MKAALIWTYKFPINRWHDADYPLKNAEDEANLDGSGAFRHRL